MTLNKDNSQYNIFPEGLNATSHAYQQQKRLYEKQVKTENNVYLPDIVGKGYKDFWNFKGRYRVVKGSRASKKSTTTALNIVYRMMKYPQANTLVVRKTFKTLKDSAYSQIKWAINRLGVQDYWKAKVNPLEIEYIPTGQKIIFRGLDDPLKLTSITVPTGYICWCWIEEAYEIMDEKSFNMLDESIRGYTGDTFKQITLTMNPWSDKHWIKTRFFDYVEKYPEDSDYMAITTNYKCNEWLDESDLQLFKRMKNENPQRYKVAGLGEWGVTQGLVYENWKETKLNDSFVRMKYPDGQFYYGLDFGYSNDPSAFIKLYMVNNEKHKKIFVLDEMYETHMSNESIYNWIVDHGYSKEVITADSANPKDIDRLRTLGLLRIRPAKKGSDSILNGINYIQEFEINVNNKCTNFMTEISNYQWEENKFGNRINKPVDDFNHLQDAMRYAVERTQWKNQAEIKMFKKGI